MNEQGEIMEKLNEKGKVVENGASGIKEGRLKMLRKNYLRPETYELSSEYNWGMKDCSDMASCMGYMCCAGYA